MNQKFVSLIVVLVLSVTFLPITVASADDPEVGGEIVPHPKIGCQPRPRADSRLLYIENPRL